MWTTLVFVNLGALLLTVSSSPPSPNNVNFTSVNLRNILHWLPGNGAHSDTHFTVQYAIYGVSVTDSKGKRSHWRPMARCTKIARNWCDLSNETWDLEHGYFARVRAVSGKSSSKWVLTGRFDPKSETTFGPPLVSVELEDNTAIVTLKGPMRFQPNNHSPAVSMATLYPQMVYNLSINNSGVLSHLYGISNPLKYRLLEYDKQYCFSATSKFFSMPFKCHQSGWHCITTPSDPVYEQMKKISLGIAVATVFTCVLLLVGYMLYQYLTGDGQKTPYILKEPSFKALPMMVPPENVNFILMSIPRPSDIKRDVSEAAQNQPQPFVGPPPGYAPQRSDAPQPPEGSWGNESVVYGFVGTAPKINVGNGEEENVRRHDRGDNLNGPRDHQRCVARDSYEDKVFTVNVVVKAPQAQSYLSQISTHTFLQTSSPKQETFLSFQGATKGEMDREEEVPGLFHIPLSPQSVKEGGVGEEMDGVRVIAGGEIDGEMQMESRSERAPLLSGYASQNVPRSCFDQSGRGVLRQRTEEDNEMEAEEEVENICIEWDPESRKLMTPELAMEGGSDVLRQGEERRENRAGGEKEQRRKVEEEEEEEEAEIRAAKAQPTLENVYVRQGSEEEAEAHRQHSAGVWVAHDILTKWDLVIPMEE